jgi:hypothetical protein
MRPSRRLTAWCLLLSLCVATAGVAWPDGRAHGHQAGNAQDHSPSIHCCILLHLPASGRPSRSQASLNATHVILVPNR